MGELFTIYWWLPYLSIGGNLMLVGVILYLVKHSSNASLQKNTDEILTTIFKEAELKASFIIHDSTEKAKNIITEASATRKEMDEKMRMVFEEVIASMRNEIKTENQAIANRMEQTITEVSIMLKKESLKMIDELRTEGKNQVTTFAKTLHEENKGIHNELLDQIKLEIDIIKNELQAYRDEEYKKIDQHLTIVLQTLLKEYLKSVLSYEMNDEIIFKALEQYRTTNLQPQKNEPTQPQQ
jgi:vacuolar-type H+-ATPase subunit H